MKWDPVGNPTHMIRGEISDVYKAMTKIRALEKKLKNFDLNSGQTNYDPTADITGDGRINLAELVPFNSEFGLVI